MKNTLFALLLALPASSVLAQSEFGLGIMVTAPTQRPSGIDVISSGGGFLYFGHSINFKKVWSLLPQIQLGGNRYIMDGIFQRGNTGYNFEVTPANYKQASLTMYTLGVPLILRYHVIPKSRKSGFASLGVGPYGEYAFSNQQTYKVGNVTTTEEAPIENKLNWGLCSEMTIGTASKSSRSVRLTAGASYQFSDYLANKTSFRPVSIYLRVGLGI